MTKYMEINGEQFEVIRSAKTESMIDAHFVNYRGRGLEHYYEKPSNIKREIWRDWCSWCSSCDEVHYFEITNANDFKFAIGAIYIDEYGEQGYIRITDCHNRLYLCKE